MKQRGIPVLIPVLILISMLFIGLLIFTYVETKRANPQMIHVDSAASPKQGSGVEVPPEGAAVCTALSPIHSA
ncbi:MAG: hypothetical protein ABI759_20955 [Candidatus Solibacter sp.]